MTQLRTRCFVPLLLAAIVSACSSYDIRTESISDLCEIAANPAQFNGKIVRVVGHVAPEAHYNSFLYSDNCRRTAFIMGTNEAVERTEAYDSLRSILWSTYPEQKQSATIDVVAKFEWRSDEVPARIMWAKKIISVRKNPGVWKPD